MRTQKDMNNVPADLSRRAMKTPVVNTKMVQDGHNDVIQQCHANCSLASRRTQGVKRCAPGTIMYLARNGYQEKQAKGVSMRAPSWDVNIHLRDTSATYDYLLVTSRLGSSEQSSRRQKAVLTSNR